MSDRPCNYGIEWYAEDEGLEALISRIEEKGWRYAYILHDKDKNEQGENKKAHYQFLVRTGNGMTLSAFLKNAGVRYAEVLKSWEGFAVYLIHADEKSKANPYQFQYPENDLRGNMVDDVKRILRNKLEKKQKSKSEDDMGIIDILDFIASMDYVTMDCLVRWTCQNGLYSVFRRAGRIVSEVLAEHNRNCQFTLQDTLYQLRLEEMEKRMTKAEKELERAYGDLWTRAENPWTGKVIADNDIFDASVRQINSQIKEILKKDA